MYARGLWKDRNAEALIGWKDRSDRGAHNRLLAIMGQTFVTWHNIFPSSFALFFLELGTSRARKRTYQNRLFLLKLPPLVEVFKT